MLWLGRFGQWGYVLKAERQHEELYSRNLMSQIAISSCRAGKGRGAVGGWAGKQVR